MGVFTFVCRSSGDQWTARQLSGDLEASASSTYDLQRLLVQAALATDVSSSGVQTSFSMVTPTSAVFQVIVGGAAGAGGGAAAAGAAPVGNAAEPEAPSELKKEEEESDDDYMGISLFDWF